MSAPPARFVPYALIALLYAATWPFHGGLNNPNEIVRVYMTKALVDEGTASIDGVIREWGGVDDKAVREGRLYSSKAPLQSLLGVPVYAALRAADVVLTKRTLTTWLRIFGSALPGFFLAAALLAYARRRATELGAPRRAGTAVGLTLAFGTMLYPYAITFTGHILAACTAGGAYLATIAFTRSEPGGRRWRWFAALTGFLAGAAPFAEYPAALVAGPALIAAFFHTQGARKRAELCTWLAVGGATPFALGLWAHQISWGSPFRTGYSWLENRAYVEVHGSGFFGVQVPKAEALIGSLFSPGTGLFFFSPVLAIGLVAIVHGLFSKDDRRLPRGIALCGLVGIAAELVFISGHTGWRGGWTLGPRYIIPVAVVLGVWVVEALRVRWLRSLIAPLACVSIVATGFAAALYPHLSDVYTNPLHTFVWPSYARGEFSYGIAHTLGLEGTAANLVHIVPLFATIIFVAATAGGRAITGLFAGAIAVGVTMAGIRFIPERDPAAALRENERLWGFWEPEPSPARPPGLVTSAREAWRTLRVEAKLGEDGRTVECRWFPDHCQYGGMDWQRLKPDRLLFAGKREPVLFVHPIEGWIVRISLDSPADANSAVFRYGLNDESMDSSNSTPVDLRVSQGRTTLGQLRAGDRRGLLSLPFKLDGTHDPVIIELRSTRDGARVVGLELELYGTDVTSN